MYNFILRHGPGIKLHNVRFSSDSSMQFFNAFEVLKIFYLLKRTQMPAGYCNYITFNLFSLLQVLSPDS